MNWLMNLAVDKNFRRQGIGSAMMKFLLETMKLPKASIRLVNVESADTGMIKFLENSGFEMKIKQYEMEMEI